MNLYAVGLFKGCTPQPDNRRSMITKGRVIPEATAGDSNKKEMS
jgi:hypothetical protein